MFYMVFLCVYVLAVFFNKSFGIKSDILLQNGPKGECEYVSPSAMKEFNVHRNKKEGTTFGCKTVVEFAKKAAEGFHENDYISVVQSNEKGFLQIKSVILHAFAKCMAYLI